MLFSALPRKPPDALERHSHRPESPRSLDRPRLAAVLLARSARSCGPCFVGAGSSARPLSFPPLAAGQVSAPLPAGQVGAPPAGWVGQRTPAAGQVGAPLRLVRSAHPCRLVRSAHPRGRTDQRTPAGWVGQRTPAGWVGQRTPAGWVGQRTPAGWVGQRIPDGWSGQRSIAREVNHTPPQPIRSFTPPAFTHSSLARVGS